MIRSFFESDKLLHDLEKFKISIGPIDYLSEHFWDLALDVIGFPVDDTNLEEEATFCRDYLINNAPTEIELANLDSEVERYVDYLYSEFEALKKEEPHLFE
ncbi:MAG: hypothetical protein NC187_08045 [Candidatus Amulumruptor caecigallinarius]|nr:hypothetical protein [Candidatus Amulumruptor caecigallinarius]MCM1397420.1 hypothetical protein [Candidatus Amulumruptor caecigallinarius]MCM1454373.1 hypothetical protein [bacterium]